MNKIFKQITNGNLYEGEDTGAGGSEEEVIEEVVDNAEGEEVEGEEEEVIEEIDEEELSEEEKAAKAEKEAKEKEDKDEETTEDQRKDSVIKKVLAEDKKFFKKYPELRDSYFAAKAYREVFTSVEEAKEAENNSNTLAKISSDLQTGNPKVIIDYLKDEPKVLTQVARNFIKELPKEVYSDAMAPSVIELLGEIKAAAKLHKNEDLENSVGWISKYLFNNHELPALKEEKVEEKKEENPLLLQMAKNFNEEVSEDAISSLNSIIDSSLASLKNVRPAVRKAIVQEIKEELDNTIGKDDIHKKLMQKLWADAAKSNYSKQSKASIKSAYLAAVNKRLPEVRATVLKNNGFAVKKGQKKTTTENKTPEFRKVNDSSSSSSKPLDAKIAEMKKSGASEREVMDALIK